MKHTAHETHFSRTTRVSLFTMLVRKSFLFLVARIHRSRLAALGAAMLALLFARRLTTQAAAQGNSADSRSRVIDGEYRRINETR